MSGYKSSQLAANNDTFSPALVKTGAPFFNGEVSVRGKGGIWATYLLWRERSRARRALRGMDRRMLEDIGIEREEALREARKPFWMA